jgi:hypothetical protein
MDNSFPSENSNREYKRNYYKKFHNQFKEFISWFEFNSAFTHRKPYINQLKRLGIK